MVDRPNKPSSITPSTLTQQPTVTISPDSNDVTAQLATGESVQILLHGATVTSWRSQKGNHENLWLSSAAVLDGSKPVRGGIPLVFPVFGPPPKDHATSKLSQHGFARNSRWEFLGKSSSESGAISKSGKGDDCVKLDFGLFPSALSSEAREAWPHDFGLIYSVTLGVDSLQTMLNVRNEGKDAFEFQMLLHSYFSVEDIGKTTVTGLLGTTYTDKVADGREVTESSNAVAISGETDRVYAKISQDTTGVLTSGQPRFEVVRDNLSDTVVWNPGKQKAQAMGDFVPKEDWTRMLCVEVGAVNGWQKLEPGETFEAGQNIRSHGRGPG